MRLTVIYFLIGLAGWAKSRFELFDKPENEPSLLLACSFTKRAFKALPGFYAVFFANFFVLHNILLPNQ
jgi:hypothetical protein